MSYKATATLYPKNLINLRCFLTKLHSFQIQNYGIPKYDSTTISTLVIIILLKSTFLSDSDCSIFIEPYFTYNKIYHFKE